MNNFFTWCVTYDKILYPYYLDFIKLFEREDRPTYDQFLDYCYKNTTKTKNNGILTAYITNYV